MVFIKAVAAVLVLFATRTLVTEYKKYEEKKLAALDDFAALFSFIKGELGCRLRTVSEWARDLDCDVLAECGFTDELIKTGSLSSAFSVARAHLPALGEEATKLLSQYFMTFGRAYRDEEMKATARASEDLSRIISRERSDTQRSFKAARVLSYAVAVGIIILFL